MAVEGTVVEVKRGEPVPAHVGVGDVVVVQPDHGGPKFGMPHAEVTVSALSSEWPFPMCCSVWKATSASGARRWRGKSWLDRAVRKRHRHAIEQASRRWRGGRRANAP